MASNRTGPQSAYDSLQLLRSSQPVERADAARNRAAILTAAARLFAEHGVDGVSLDAVAAEAGVGKGTLYRRFGDKSGLAVALLDERERELQQRILSGPAPLGPGAEPAARLRAFCAAYLDYALAHLDLLRMSETSSPGARYRIGAYRFWHRHAEILIELLRWPDADVAAHAVLAPLASEHLTALVESVGEDRVRRGAADHLDRLLG